MFCTIPIIIHKILHFHTAPSNSPQVFNATTTSPYSAILTWEPPSFDQQNGVITGYIISVSVLETNETFLLYSNTTYLIVTVLKPFRTYMCIIAAQTGVGTGPFGSQFVLNTPEDGMYVLIVCFTLLILIFL